MRTIEQINGIDKEVSSDFPDGAIVNQDDTRDGTPVVREIYNDILANVYKLLDLAGIEPTGLEDSASKGYQIIDALKLLSNDLNDSEQVLSLTGSVWSIPLKLSILPDKYFVFVRATEDYVSGSSYTFKGSEVTTYPFTSTGFKSGDLLLVIIDQAGVRAYSIAGATSSSANEIFTVMGTPVAFNDTAKVWYQEAGVLMSDVPSSDDLEARIRVDVSDGTVLVIDMFVLNGFVLCFCIIPASNTYFFRQFDLQDLSSSDPVTISGTAFSNASDFFPYVYAEQGAVYVTNNMNTSANDYSIAKLTYNPGAATLTLYSVFAIDNTFVKTTNAAIKGTLLYTMISGALNSFNLSSGSKVSLGSYSGVAGQIFGFNGFVYFTSGEVAKKWF